MHTVTVDSPSLGVPVKRVNVGDYFVVTECEHDKSLIGQVFMRCYSPNGHYEIVCVNRPGSTWNDRTRDHLPSWTVRILQKGETFTVKIGDNE